MILLLNRRESSAPVIAAHERHSMITYEAVSCRADRAVVSRKIRTIVIGSNTDLVITATSLAAEDRYRASAARSECPH
jgi:hypothetical protein